MSTGIPNARMLFWSVLSSGLLLLFVAPAPGYAQGNYLLAPNDLVAVTVFQEDDLATKSRVGNDGTISVPLIGTVKVGGKSVDEAAQIIRSRLAKGYLVNPQVNVGVEEFAKRLVTVLGEVQKGGTFEFPNQGPLDLLQAIGLAGGYSKVANPGKIVVKRRVDGKETVLLVNGKALAAKAGVERFEVFPGDTITVAQSIF
ncbi:MAG: polysaccharide export protein [Verrucomicrobia bacterium]|nr:MAG: polysaccharide export protein [Verrucomicrobiota bacterium]